MTEPSKKLTREDLATCAALLGVDVPAIMAVDTVESGGEGFLPDGRPKILYERHVMRRQLQAKGIPTELLELNHPALVSRNPGGYGSGTQEWERLAQAIKIDRECALCSASWGRYQIMGFNWKPLGYASVQEFVNAQYRSEGGQLEAFSRFIKATPSALAALRAKDWAAFAKAYNGPNYAINKYDEKLKAAYAAAVARG